MLLAAAASYKVRSHEAIAEAVKFGRLDLAEVCCSSDSKLTQQVLALGVRPSATATGMGTTWFPERVLNYSETN